MHEKWLSCIILVINTLPKTIFEDSKDAYLDPKSKAHLHCKCSTFTR